MSSNFAFNNGMTIQIPPFNAASDQLFLTIKNYLDIRFNEIDDKINEIISKNNEMGEYLTKIEKDIEDIKAERGIVEKSNNGDKHISSYNKRKIFKPMKRKIFPSKLLKSFIRDDTKVSQKLENSFLLDFNNGSFNVAVENVSGENIHSELPQIKEEITLKEDMMEPFVVFNPADNREIFIGGNSDVKLSFWAYKKCLSCIRGKPNELNSRLCLRLLQAKFGRQYMLSHNYNGSGDKLPIDRVIMQAILAQVKMQFPNQEDMQNNPARFAMFRDYINNAFRVVAYRHRKGIQSNTPFWDHSGEPITDLDPPTWVLDHNK